VQTKDAVGREIRVRQSIVRWAYQQMPLDTLCQVAADIGFEGIDVLAPEDFHVPARYGLRCTMGFVGLGDNKFSSQKCFTRRKTCGDKCDRFVRAEVVGSLRRGGREELHLLSKAACADRCGSWDHYLP
jgi:hypothetical protein